MTDLKSMTPEELTAWCREQGQPAFRGRQLFQWLSRGVVSTQEMTDLPKALRAKIDQEGGISPPSVERKQVSKLDGTIKYLWRLSDGNCIETVLMRYRHGNSVCISSQVGCAMGCAFCASTVGGRVRNLTAGELLDQVIFTQKDSGVPISNIVLMGIGEPLDNYDNVRRFLTLVNHPDGVNIGMRHISLSTCGLIRGIDRLAEEGLQLTLSVSLHAPDDETRSALMPINRGTGVEALLAACRRYFAKTGRRISYEYAMIDGVNDTPRHAALLGDRCPCESHSSQLCGGEQLKAQSPCGRLSEAAGKAGYSRHRPPAAGQRYRRLLRPAAPESPAKPGGMRRAGDAKGDDPPWFPYGD